MTRKGERECGRKTEKISEMAYAEIKACIDIQVLSANNNLQSVTNRFMKGGMNMKS